MSKTKFKYNPEKLSYEEVELTWKDYFRKFAAHFATGSVIAVISVLALYQPILNKGKKLAHETSNKNLFELEGMNRQLDEIDAVLSQMQERDDNIYRSIFEADPYPTYKRKPGTGGNPESFEKYKNYAHADLVLETSKKIESIQKKLVAQGRSFDEVVKMVRNKEKMLRSVPSIQPISNIDLTRIASGFGVRMHPIYKILKMHAGLDFTADRGTEIYATGDGKVEKVDWMSGYGKIVIIDHGFGYKTRYAHCSAYKVRKGQKVKRGDVIALVGNSGASVGPHLHYEVRKDGNPVNPVNYFFNDLSPEEYEEVLRLSAKPTQSM